MFLRILALLLVSVIPAQSQYISSLDISLQTGISGHTDTAIFIRLPMLQMRLDTSNPNNKTKAIRLDEPGLQIRKDSFDFGYKSWMSALIDTLQKSIQIPFLIEPAIIELESREHEHLRTFIITYHTEPCNSEKLLVRVFKEDLYQFFHISSAHCGEGFANNSITWLLWNPNIFKWDIIELNYKGPSFSGYDAYGYNYLKHHMMNPNNLVYGQLLNRQSYGRSNEFIDKYLAVFGLKSNFKIR